MDMSELFESWLLLRRCCLMVSAQHQSLITHNTDRSKIEWKGVAACSQSVH
jgi:hypothetical protein